MLINDDKNNLEDDSKEMAMPIKLFIALILIIVLVLTAIGSLTYVFKNYFAWESTLVEFRKNAETEREEFNNQMERLNKVETEKLEILINQQKEAEDKINEMNKTIAKLENDVEKERQLTARNNELEALLASINSDISSAKSELDELNKNYSILIKSYSELDGTYQNVLKVLEDNTKKNQELQENNINLSEMNNNLTNSINTLNARIQELNENSKDIDSNINQLTEKQLELVKDIERLETTKSIMEDQIASMEFKNSELDKIISEQNNKLTSLKADAQKSQNLIYDIDRLALQKSQNDEELAISQDLLISITKDVGILEGTKNQLTNEVERLQKQLENINSEIRTRSLQLSALTGDLYFSQNQ